MGPWSTLSKVLRAIGIQGGSVNILPLTTLLSLTSLSISAGDVGCPGCCVYVDEWDDYLVDLRVELW